MIELHAPRAIVDGFQQQVRFLTAAAWLDRVASISVTLWGRTMFVCVASGWVTLLGTPHAVGAVFPNRFWDAIVYSVF